MLHKMRALAHMAYGVLKKYRTLIACAIAVVPKQTMPSSVARHSFFMEISSNIAV